MPPMSPRFPPAHCPLCGAECPADVLAEAAWLAEPAIAHLPAARRGWRRELGACPACAQTELLAVLTHLEPGRHRAAWNCWPAPLRLLADPRYTGRGVTAAVVDAGFYPHPDLTRPRNRIRAWVEVGSPRVRVRTFGPADEPRWPGWDD